MHILITYDIAKTKNRTKVATPTRWRKGKYKLATIIEEQALELAHTIKGTQAKFKGFVARY